MRNDTSPTPEKDKNAPMEEQEEPSLSTEGGDESLQIIEGLQESEISAPEVDWEAQLKELEAEVAKLHHEKLRALADLQNFRRRALTQIAEARQEAIANFVTELLPILDNFERTLRAAQSDAPKEALVEGIALTHRQLMDILRAFQIEPIPALGEPFNPLLHEAISTEETEGDPGIILEEIQKGYRMGTKVLRPVKVKVSKPIPAKVNPEEEHQP